MDINKKKKKDLILRILNQKEDNSLDKGMTILPRNYKMFLKKRVRYTSSRRQEDEGKGKEIKRDFNIKEKKENTKDKI